MSPAPRKLSDILSGGTGSIRDTWNTTSAAGDDRPIPPGEYVCHAVAGGLFNAKTKGTPGYKIAFDVIEGPHAGRRVWHDVWLTPAALPRAKRDLARLGVTSLDQLERPIPERLRCVVRVTVRNDDGGRDYNHVQRYEVIGIDAAPPNPFAPPAPATEPLAPPPAAEGA